MDITPEQKAAFDQLFDLVGYRCGSIFIAGGAVADLTRAGDIDIWIGGGKEKVAHNLVCSLPQRYFIKDAEVYFAGGAVGTHLMGGGYLPSIGKLIQVMWTESSKADEILNGFDISTHMWAYTSKGKLIQGQHATDIDVAPRCLKFRAKTFERYVKICQRYGHPVDVNQLPNDQANVKYTDPLGTAIASTMNHTPVVDIDDDFPF